MLGLLQPAGPVDAMQNLTLMMAVMILGAPQVHSCNMGAGLRASWDTSLLFYYRKTYALISN
jgi:hypothetical protein